MASRSCTEKTPSFCAKICLNFSLSWRKRRSIPLSTEPSRFLKRDKPSNFCPRSVEGTILLTNFYCRTANTRGETGYRVDGAFRMDGRQTLPWDYFRVVRHLGVVGHFAKLPTELYIVSRYTSSERRVRMSSRAETKFVIRL